MTKREWKIGDVTVTVEAPDDVYIRGVTVRVKPMSRTEFLAAADAVGGLSALRLPVSEERFPQDATVSAVREDGTADTYVYVAIEEPPLERATGATKPPHPFFGPLKARVEREADVGSAT